MDKKQCCECKRWGILDDFHNNRKRVDGKSDRCKWCTNRRVREYRQAQKRTEKQGLPPISPRKQKRYQVTTEEYHELNFIQTGQCAICRNFCSLNIDHDHSTGEVRGLLCTPCNTALGMLRDDPKNLQRAIEYLKDPPINFVRSRLASG